MNPDKDKRVLAEKAARLLNGEIDADLILAVIYTESGGDPWAMRYEPGFYERYVLELSAKEGLTQTEARARATSWGLMQVMGQVARELGYKKPYLAALCDPWDGIWFGSKHLARKIKLYGFEGGISAYNHGQPAKDLSADPYLKKVLAALREIRKAA